MTSVSGDNVSKVDVLFNFNTILARMFGDFNFVKGEGLSRCFFTLPAQHFVFSGNFFRSLSQQ